MRLLTAFLLFLSLGTAQIPGISSGSVKDLPAPKFVDPYGRETPRGAVLGFVRAAQAGKWDRAAMYLQMTEAERKQRGEKIATEFQSILDQELTSSLESIPNRPEGVTDDGLPPDRERLKTVVLKRKEVDILLVRVPGETGDPIWLFAHETVRQIPAMYEELGAATVENHLPQGLVQQRLFGIPLWQWLASLLLFPVSAAAGWIVARLLTLPFLRHATKAPGWFWQLRAWPLVTALAIGIHGFVLRWLALPLLFRFYYRRLYGVAVVIALAWIAYRIIDMLIDRFQRQSASRGSNVTDSVAVLGRRVLKVIVFTAALLGVLAALGFDVSTALAGVGIGGIAIALAAQKTLENFVGGVTLLTDQALHVGDAVKIGTRVGTVEDVSLRSTRIRTLEGSLVAIPNGTLATQEIENFADRERFLFNPLVNLRYETTPDQMRWLLAEFRKLLYQHPKVEPDGARARFSALGAASLDVQFFARIRAADIAEFFAVQEELLLRIIDIVNASGSGFAFPSQTLYFARDTGLDAEKQAAAEKRVQQLREGKQLPFPDYPPAQREKMQGELPWPPEGSIDRS